MCCFVNFNLRFRNCVYPDISTILRYESTFFHDVVNGRDIVSWGAVDSNRSDGRSDELIGFVTARIVLAKESEVTPSIYSYICLLSNYLKHTKKMLSVHHFQSLKFLLNREHVLRFYYSECIFRLESLVI